MNKFKKILLSPGITAAALIAAIGLLAFSGIGTARAVLSSYSQTYTSEVQTSGVSVALAEDCEIEKSTKLQLGKAYKDNLSAVNNGATPEYIRVTIYKYWTNKEGKKCTVSPDLIGLNLVGVGSTWAEDTAAKTDQRTVLYCKNLVPAGGSVQFADTLTIDKAIAHLDKVTQSEPDANGKIISSFDYNGIQYHIDVEVDAVQEHNATLAIKSAWGVDAAAVGINAAE